MGFEGKFLDVSWLSDFGYEHERLFIQSESRFQIRNITNCHCLQPIHYDQLIRALNRIDSIFCASHYFKSESSKEEMALVRNILNRSVNHSDDGYGQTLIQTYFEEKTSLVINYSILK